MRLILIILFFIFYFNTFSQNLVPNPSFEYYSACPSGCCQLSLATPWIATPNDAEYYNSCSSDPIFSVPNQGGYCFQYAHSGNAFIGINLYDGIDNNYREYAYVHLLSTLQPNYCYSVDFYVNLASGIGGKFAVNNVACSFSNNAVSSPGSSNNVLNLIPYIYKLGNPIINDTLNWVKISGIYQATGGEQYIVIGNFKDDSYTDTLDTGVGDYASAYYFIDDVSVIPIDSINMPAYAGHDTSIILGDSVFIGQEITNLNCNWYVAGNLIASNISGLYVKPTESTTYIVEQNLCGTITYDTVLIKVNHAGIAENETWENNVKVYPNPTTGTVYIAPMGIKCDNIQVNVTDLAGKIVYSSLLSIHEGICNFNLKIEPGIYFIKITDCSSDEKITKKLVIQ